MRGMSRRRDIFTPARTSWNCVHQMFVEGPRTSVNEGEEKSREGRGCYALAPSWWFRLPPYGYLSLKNAVWDEPSSAVIVTL